MATTSLTVKGSLPALKGCSRITGSFSFGVSASGVFEVYNIEKYGLTIMTIAEPKHCGHYIPLAALASGIRPTVQEIKERPLIFCNECAEFYPWWKYLDMGA